MNYAELGLGPGELEYVDVVCGNRSVFRLDVCHVYNHISAEGRGYHFDALLDAFTRPFEETVGKPEGTGVVLEQAAQNPPIEKMAAAPQTTCAKFVYKIAYVAARRTCVCGFWVTCIHALTGPMAWVLQWLQARAAAEIGEGVTIV